MNIGAIHFSTSDDLSHWMRLQESINRDIAEELNALSKRIKELEDTINVTIALQKQEI
jgi:hypothetical protein